jgi:nucleoside-diphosphate-sugar epimerase
MRVLVTGGSGFIGTNLVQHYMVVGAEVMNLDFAPPCNRTHVAAWRNVDLRDRDSLLGAVAEFDPHIVFHMGARTDLGGRSVDDYSANVAGVVNLVDALRLLQNLRLAVFASTMLVCRIGYLPVDEFDYCPSTSYGESKVLGERIVRDRAGATLPWVIVRPTSIWGPWFRAPYRDFFAAVQRGYFAQPKGVRVRRSYGFVLNNVFQLATLATLADRAEGGLMHRTVYMADYKPVELMDWAELIRRETGAPKVRVAPMWLFRGAAIFGDILKRFGYQTPPMSSFRLNNLLTEMVFDMSPLQETCGSTPYTLEEGVRITCDWMRSDAQGR